MRGERPRKPLDAESLGFSETLWELVRLCWSEASSARPTAQRLLDCFSSTYITWDPPLVYPATVTDDLTTDEDLYSFSGLYVEVSQGVGAVDSIGDSLVLVVVLLLLLYI